MATREEKAQVIKELKLQVEDLKQQVEVMHLENAALLQKQRRREIAGGLLRTGIVLLAVGIGIGIGAIFL